MDIRRRLIAALAAVILVTTTSALAQTLILEAEHFASSTGARAMATADFDRNGWADAAMPTSDVTRSRSS